MKIAVIGNNTSDIINARGKLIEALINKKHEVVAIGNEDIDKKKLQNIKFKNINIKFNRISINIFKNIKYIYELTKVLKKEKIDLVLLYTPKPIICGSIAARFANVKRVYSLFAGLGYHYSINTFRTFFVRIFCDFGYRIACKLNTKVILQNTEDREELIKRNFVKKEKTAVVDGSGVDLKKFKKSENIIDDMNKLKFLMISRGLNVKGIKELNACAEEIHKIYPEIEFIHVGNIEKTYRDITLDEKQMYSKNIRFIGKVDNVYDYVKKANVVILPSYLREEIPRVLLEGLAVGRPIITTNLRGCKETVIDKKNGYLVEARDVKDLTEKVLLMIESSKEKIQDMSEASYELAKKRFDVDIINKKMLEIMEV